MRSHVGDVTTVHHGHMPEIEILSPTTARGVWAMEDKLRWPEGSPIQTMHGYGHYHETYELVDGAWRISTLTLTRLRLDVEMAGSSFRPKRSRPYAAIALPRITARHSAASMPAAAKRLCATLRECGNVPSECG